MCINGIVLDSAILTTAKFVEQINNFFDLINIVGSKPFRKKIYHWAVSKDSKHVEFWQEIV